MFAVKGSVGQELSAFKALVSGNAEKSKEIFATGEKLIVLAGNGEFAQFKRLAYSLDPHEIMTYFSAKALMASLIGGHLMLSTFILDNGYPLSITVGVPHTLHDCLRELSDHECVPIVKLFMSKGYNVNTQEPGQWWAPLHIAVSRELVDTVETLLQAGADVNIVGAEDAMPLSLALALGADSPGRESITAALTARGAKTTWRKTSAEEHRTGNANTFGTPSYASNTEVRVGGGAGQATEVHSQPVVYNPPPQRVRFNGASVQLEPVPLPSGHGLRTTVTGASGSNLPPVPPQVSVSTASGKPLQPPPRLRKQEGAGLDAGAGAGARAQAAADEEEDDGAEEEVDQERELTEAVTEKLHVNDAQGGTGGALVGVSDDGRAMLFSTG